MLDDTDKVVAAADMYWSAQSEDFLPTLMANETLDLLKFGGEFELKEFECLPTFSSTFTVEFPPRLALGIVIPPCPHPYTNYKIRLFAPKTAEEILDELRRIDDEDKSFPKTAEEFLNEVRKMHGVQPPKKKIAKRVRFEDDDYAPRKKKRGPYKKTLIRLGIIKS